MKAVDQLGTFDSRAEPCPARNRDPGPAGPPSPSKRTRGWCNARRSAAVSTAPHRRNTCMLCWTQAPASLHHCVVRGPEPWKSSARVLSRKALPSQNPPALMQRCTYIWLAPFLRLRGPKKCGVPRKKRKRKEHTLISRGFTSRDEKRSQ